MNGSTLQKRLTVLRAKFKDLPIDTAWIIQPENRRYLSGFTALDSQLTESSGALLIHPERSILVTDSRYTLQAEREAKGFEVETLKEGLVESFPQLLKRTQTRRLGFEEDHLTCGLYNRLGDKLRDSGHEVELVPMKGLVERMREVKDGDEVEAMEASAALMSAILDEVVSGLRAGVSEKQVAWQIEGLAREGGAEDLAFPSIVASGPNGALPHAVPTDRRLGEREPVIFDVGIKLNGYCCDMTRTIFLGEPTEDFKKIYRTVRQAQQSALPEVRPGVQSTRPDSVARTLIADAGYGDYFGHALGHGVGLATHEGPRLSPREPVELREGMVVTVEPGIYIPGKGGVRLEEMVVIEKEGPRILTKNTLFYAY